MGGFADDEIPLLVMLFYLFRGVEPSRSYRGLACDYKQIFPFCFPSSRKRSVAVLGAPYPSALGWDQNPWAQELGSSSSLERSPAKSITPGRVRIFTYESNAVGNREPAVARRRLREIDNAVSVRARQCSVCES